MKQKILFLIGLLFLLSGLSYSAEWKYHSYEELTRKLQQLKKTHPQLMELQSLGKTREKRDIWLVQITNKKKGNPDEKSALFLCGNIEGDHLIGSESVLATIQTILDGHGNDSQITQLVDDHTCYFIPRVNPDGAEYFFKNPKWPARTNLVPTDDDLDGLIDEDHPEDLNKDGIISQMRVKKPEGTLLPDTSDTRLLQKAKPEKGEKGIYLLYPEGIDSDGDGKYNEDPAGGVNIDRNFPHAYPYFQENSGPYMTSETETRAIIDFLVAHRNVTIVLTYSLHDNLIQSPKPRPAGPARRPAESEDPGMRFRRSRKAETTINSKDLPYLQELGKRYRESMGIESSDNNQSAIKSQGTFFDWAYYQYGTLSLSTPLWQPPAIKTESDTVSRRRPMRIKPGKKEEVVSNDLKFLKWIDKTRNGEGFLPWKPFQHPQLGSVEIGGFLPYLRTNPPVDLLPGLFKKQTDFVISLGGLFPKLAIPELEINREADYIYRIKMTLQNQGYLPTALAHGVKARAVKPILIKLQAEGLEILAGSRLTFCDTLSGSGGTKKYSWLVKVKPNTRGKLIVQSEKAGDIIKPIQFK